MDEDDEGSFSCGGDLEFGVMWFDAFDVNVGVSHGVCLSGSCG